ncbi:MAG: hypothetical protein R3E68_15875 [Burkholderiaceae bacterium]
MPGFTVGKRLVNPRVARYRYGTVYGGDTVDVFHSPSYLERLNNPTEWSKRVQPAFSPFPEDGLRADCLERRVGEGGAVATFGWTGNRRGRGGCAAGRRASAG